MSLQMFTKSCRTCLKFLSPKNKGFLLSSDDVSLIEKLTNVRMVASFNFSHQICGECQEELQKVREMFKVFAENERKLQRLLQVGKMEFLSPRVARRVHFAPEIEHLELPVEKKRTREEARKCRSKSILVTSDLYVKQSLGFVCTLPSCGKSFATYRGLRSHEVRGHRSFKPM